jgi:anaerobic selenocysteine-containing dehydrogenase
VDAYGFRLVATRTLYDEGTLVTHSPSLRGLSREARVRMNPADLTRLGLGPAATVAITSPRGRMTLETIADTGVPPGAVGMHLNHRGADPADLIDAGAAVTAVQVETIAAEGDA